MSRYNFAIRDAGPVSAAFLQRGLGDFQSAAGYVRQLPYGRNADKSDILSVLYDAKGTCSTKHALLKQLAVELRAEEVELVLCMFKMNAFNTPVLTDILQQYNLDYIPEAHVYLRVSTLVLDCTKARWSIERFTDDVLEERMISPEQITDYKVSYHRDYLERWLQSRPGNSYSLEVLWTIREECIRALSGTQEI